MEKRIRVWVISPDEPIDKSVAWVDTTVWEQWVIKFFRDGQWEAAKTIDDEEIREEIRLLNEKINNIQGFVVVSELPSIGDSKKIYLLGPTGTGADQYEEYIYSEGSWVKIGDTSIDLSEYTKKVDVPVEKGIGTNSIQQKGTGAEAMGESSIATGVGSFAGQKGYKYTNTGNVTNQLTLTSVDGLAVGDVVSIVNKAKYPDCSTITGITGNTITLDSLPFDSIVPDLTDFDDYLVYVSEKPNVGDVDLAIAAHAEGDGAKAQNYTAHAEGRDTQALGEYSHAEGRGTVAQYAAHAEGKGTEASGEESHSEGINTKALGKHAHAEGDITEATNYNAHAEGYLTKATGNSAHAEGGKWIKGATGAARINGGIANGDGSHAEGGKTTSEGDFSHAEGYLTIANENNSHAEGQNSRTGGETRPSLGGTNGSQNSHAEGSGTWANGLGAHSEGGHTVASGNYSHAEGYETQAGGLTKLGPNSHTEGFKTSTGDTTLFDTTSANANTTPGAHAHAEGNVTVAMGRGSHAEGEKTKAEGIASHAEGKGTVANNIGEHAEGQFNVSISGKTQHSVGIGTADNARKNAHTITTDGKHYIPNVGGYTGEENTPALINSRQDLAKVVNGKEDISNKVTSISASSTHTQYASAKAVYDALQNSGRGIYYCDTNTSPSDISDAIAQGKLPVFVEEISGDENGYYYLCGRYTNDFIFIGGYGLNSGTTDYFGQWVVSAISEQPYYEWSYKQLHYDVFKAERNTTKYSDVGYNNNHGKICYCDYNNGSETIKCYLVSTPLTIGTTDPFVFCGFDSNTKRVYILTLESDNSWDDSSFNIVSGSGINNIVSLTQAEYDALTTKDANTLYVIK